MPSVSEKQHRAMEAAAHGHSTLGIPQNVGEEFVRRDGRRESLKVVAGILFRAESGNYLILKRDDGGWDLPGGHCEDDETPHQGAIRETTEEIGFVPEGEQIALRTQFMPEKNKTYTTFLQEVQEEFVPQLNDEHTEYVWTNDPESIKDIHPEIVKSIEYLNGHELDIAKLIQSGTLHSPQKHENIWLFDVRITGTGTSYRDAHDEFVYRPPENFLSQDFLDRCIGLPLLFEHTDEPILTTAEYRERAIGTVILPYVKNNEEVWGIAKVYDDDAAQLMMTTHRSTSPGVVTNDQGTDLGNGKTLLIESEPRYIDHLAICMAGVWDKGEEPNGINLGVTDMPEDNKTTDELLPARRDSETDESYKARTDRKDGESDTEYKARMDAEEAEHAKKDSAKKDEKPEARCDGESDADYTARMDKHRKDAKQAKKDAKRARKDAERLASENSELKATLARMNSMMESLSKPLDANDREDLAKAQVRADRVAQMFGDSVTPPMHGETPISYRKRLASKFQKHSKTMKDTRLDSLTGAAFDLVESKIYDDAQAVALNPSEITAGRLIPQVYKDAAGREITTFTGDPDAWMNQFKGTGIIGKINKDHKGA